MDAPIYDGRANSENFKIHKQGFQLVTSPTKANGFDDQETVEGAYYDEVKAIVRETTGAKEVFVFDHIVRLGEKNSRRKPAHHVHNDYSERTAHIRAQERIGTARFAELKGPHDTDKCLAAFGGPCAAFTLGLLRCNHD